MKQEAVDRSLYGTRFVMGYRTHSGPCSEGMMFLYYIYVYVFEVPDCGLDGA
jgi:hypothetical protein